LKNFSEKRKKEREPRGTKEPRVRTAKKRQGEKKERYAIRVSMTELFPKREAARKALQRGKRDGR